MMNIKNFTARLLSLKKITPVCLILIFPLIALADQAVYIRKEEANRAVALLKTQKEIKHYCALCEDKGVYTETIEAVESSPTGYENTWQVTVKIEGDPIDLAYTYFLDKKGRWKNVAIELDIKVDHVPKYLPKEAK